MSQLKKRDERMYADYPDMVDLCAFREMVGGIGDSFARRLIHEKRVKAIFIKPNYWISKKSIIAYVMSDDYAHMEGVEIDFIITKVDRQVEYAIASRRLAMRAQRYFFAQREDLNSVGRRIKCRVLTVAPRRCLVECYGHDIEMTQKDLRYLAIPDLKKEYHRGQTLDYIVKHYDPVKDDLVISVKEVESNPFEGAEFRHPVGCRRYGVIAGKYGGGVFCNLPDGTVIMCNYSYQHNDSDFHVDDNVILIVQRYENEKKQIYRKNTSKW